MRVPIPLLTLVLVVACASPPDEAWRLPTPADAVGADASSADAWRARGRLAAARARDRAPTAGRPKNVVLFLGDGMGVSTVTAARILKGQRAGASGEQTRLAFETLPYVALAKTYNTNQQVPDSAGTMTAIVSGVKTKAGVVGLSDAAMRGEAGAVARDAVATLLEEFEDRGLATGVVSTARITHATPAACYAHVSERDWESDADLSDAARAAGVADIALQLVEFPHGDGLEVALGGGRRAFLPVTTEDPEYPEQSGRRADGRDLTRAWLDRSPGSAWVWNHGQLDALDLDETRHLLGLFEPSHMQFEADRDRGPLGDPSLAEMTKVALDVLQRRGDGFFLMVEGGRIDHGHHAGNAYRALVDTIAFDDAVAVAMAETSPEDTLIVVTADHSHTLSIGGYPTRGNPILGVVRSNDDTGRPSDAPMLDALGLPFTTLAYANGPGWVGASDKQPAGAKRFPHFPGAVEPAAAGRPAPTNADAEAEDYLQEAGVPLPSETHGGEDVEVFAGGAGASLFSGVQEQSFVYHAIVEALGWTD